MQSLLERPVKRFAITGTGCSGTKYMNRLVSGLGIHSSHERIFNSQAPHIWNYTDTPTNVDTEVEVSYLATTRAGLLKLQGIKVIFVLRDLLQTVNTMVRIQRSRDLRIKYPDGRYYFHTNVDIFRNFVGIPCGIDVVDAVRYVISWISMAINVPDTTFMEIETLTDPNSPALDEFCSLLGLDPTPEHRTVAENALSGEPPSEEIVTWDNLDEFFPPEADPVLLAFKTMSGRFGYSHHVGKSPLILTPEKASVGFQDMRERLRRERN